MVEKDVTGKALISRIGPVAFVSGWEAYGCISNRYLGCLPEETTGPSFADSTLNIICCSCSLHQDLSISGSLVGTIDLFGPGREEIDS